MQLRRLAFAVLPVVAAAGLGGLASRDAPRVYARLDKPDWAPPASAFGPVWSALYAGIAVAGWHLEPRTSRTTHTLHLAQLVLNAAWPVAFFGAGHKPVSLAVIGALDVALVAELVRLRREDPRAALLLAPYLAWTGFATALNASVSEPA